MREFERKQLLERIERDGATVGESIPDRIEVQGEEIDLHEFVFETSRRESIPAGEQERVDRAKRNLRRERRDRLDLIEDGDLSFDEGERVADDVIGIDRALSALEQLDAPGVEHEARRQEQVDTQRWLRFLKQALGRADADGDGGRGRRRGGP